jgi:hypothetical protein
MPELPATPASLQQTQLANDQSAALQPADHAALESLRVAALPLGQLVDHLLDVIDASVDPATGEVNEQAFDVLDALNLSLSSKVQAYAHVIERLGAEADALRQLAHHTQQKAGTRTSAVKRMKLRMQAEFGRLGIDKLKTPTVTAYLQSSAPAVELTVLSDREVPDEYCVVTRVHCISKISAALKAGVALTFAQLTSSKHLRFR